MCGKNKTGIYFVGIRKGLHYLVFETLRHSIQLFEKY